MTFCHLQENLVINMFKKIVNTAAKARVDAAKTASKRIVQKTAETTRDLIGKKQLIKLLQQIKQKVRKKKMKQIKNQKFTQQQNKDSKVQMI